MSEIREIFEQELQLEEKWSSLLNDRSSSFQSDQVDELLAAYQKNLKTLKRLVRHSDRVENKLKISGQLEKEKSDQLSKISDQLSKYLSPQIYAQIFSGSTSVKVESSRKKLTVFFSDIVGFTEITDSLESEAVVEFLNFYLTEMSNIATKHGATIDKFIGDAILIFFGDPETEGVTKDATRCIEMAIEMKELMYALQGTWGKRFGLNKPMSIRIGVNTGYCTVGNFGSKDRVDYTVIGSGVNLASRLESAADPDTILISKETYLNVREMFICRSVGHLTLKGISSPVETYEVMGKNGKDGELGLRAHEFASKVGLEFKDSSELLAIQEVINQILQAKE